ncbi:MAG: protein kinase [Chloroflexi bacterium]|nr:protein kinase [Chloroflexota bacterium]
MGAVYLCEDVNSPGSRWAVKELQPAPFMDTGEQEACRIMFYREAEFLEKLSHPSIPKFKEHFTEDGRSYLVMEYIQGKTLEDILKEEKLPVSEPEAINLGLALCHVLNYLHSQKPPVLFRDLKPANIMMTPEGRLMLVDFGIARCFVTEQRTDTFRMGTVGYASPEQYGGMGGTDARSDIYSLGALLHYLLTGRNPEEETPFSFPPAKSLNPGVSVQLDGIITGCLEADRNRRFTATREIEMRLEALRSPKIVNMGLATSKTRRLLTRPIVPKEHSTRYRFVALAAILLAFLFFQFWHKPRTTSIHQPPTAPASEHASTHSSTSTATQIAPTPTPTPSETSIFTDPDHAAEFVKKGYNRSNPPSYNWIRNYFNLTPDKDGVWIEWKKYTEDGKKVLDELPPDKYGGYKSYIFPVCDRKGTLYYVEANRGICRYRNGKVSVLLPLEKAEVGQELPVRVQAMTFDPEDNRLWVLRTDGISVYNNERWRHWQINNDGVKAVSSIEQTGKVSPYFMRSSHGPYRIPILKYEVHPDYISIIDTSNEFNLLQDREGRVWIWCCNRGLWQFNKREIRKIGYKDGIPINSIYTVAEDKNGGVWVGGAAEDSDRGGLFRLYDGKWESFNMSEIIPGEDVLCTVRRIRSDPGGGVFISTEKGIAHYYKGKWRNVVLPPELANREDQIKGGSDSYHYRFVLFNFWVGNEGRLWLKTARRIRALGYAYSDLYLLENGKWRIWKNDIADAASDKSMPDKNKEKKQYFRAVQVVKPGHGRPYDTVPFTPEVKVVEGTSENLLIKPVLRYYHNSNYVSDQKRWLFSGKLPWDQYDLFKQPAGTEILLPYPVLTDILIKLGFSDNELNSNTYCRLFIAGKDRYLLELNAYQKMCVVEFGCKNAKVFDVSDKYTGGMNYEAVVDHEGRLWLSRAYTTQESKAIRYGFLQYGKEGWREIYPCYKGTDGVKSVFGTLSNIFIDKQNRLWYSNEGKKLSCMGSDSFTVYETYDPFHMGISVIAAQGNDNAYWLLYGAGGLFKGNENNSGILEWNKADDSPSMLRFEYGYNGEPQIYSLHNGTVIISIQNNLVQFNKGGWAPFEFPKKIKIILDKRLYECRLIKEDPYGNLWMQVLLAKDPDGKEPYYYVGAVIIRTKNGWYLYGGGKE